MQPSAEALLVMLLAVVAFHALIQFPFATPLYFLYTALLAILASVALASYASVSRSVFVGLLVFYAGFAAVRLIPDGVEGERAGDNRPTELLDLERGGIRVPIADKLAYERIVTLVRRHHPRGERVGDFDVMWR